nr:unnamed protein product [Haemonchus contortus]
MLWLLVAFAVPVESIKLRWYYHGDNSKCATAGMTDKSTLRMSRVYTVVFDKKTKLILFIKKFHFGESGGVGGYVNVEYKGNVTQNLGFGIRDSCATRTHILEVTETGVEKNIRLYVSDKCGVDQTWIANEGYYRLDTDTGQYLPTYYDPMQSDFYY